LIEDWSPMISSLPGNNQQPLSQYSIFNIQSL
jgi:hypothetical protein